MLNLMDMVTTYLCFAKDGYSWAREGNLVIQALGPYIGFFTVALIAKWVLVTAVYLIVFKVFPKDDRIRYPLAALLVQGLLVNINNFLYWIG